MTTRINGSANAHYGTNADRYLELIQAFPLRPLRSRADLDRAVSVIDSLIDLRKMSAAESDYLDVLSDLVEAYEASAEPTRPVGDAAMLRFLMENRELNQAETAKQTGIAESTISEVLSGKRILNRTQVGKLSRTFRVGLAAFASTD